MKDIVINISEAKANLSKYTNKVKKGARVILCHRNRPFAEIRPLPMVKEERRPFGLAKGKLHLPDDFNEPDKDIDSLFYGSDDS